MVTGAVEMILGKIAASCLVTVFAMKIIDIVYRDLFNKEPPDWFKAIGGAVLATGFVSFVAASIIIIWS